MTDSISIEGEELISSKRASKETGYTQDYIGQLARAGSIAAKRVGGHWYISQASLSAYKSKADEYKPQPPAYVPSAAESEASMSFDGKEFISASNAAKLTGYHQDYVGQLARSGKIASKQLGNRWFVDREALIDHKNEKDRLFAESPTQPASLQEEAPEVKSLQEVQTHAAHTDPFFTYSQQTADLLPNLSTHAPKLPPAQVGARSIYERDHHYERKQTVSIPIHRSAPQHVPLAQRYVARKKKHTRLFVPLVGAMLTIVVVLTFSFTDLKDKAVYALQSIRVNEASQSASGGSVSNAFFSVIERMEEIFSRELHYSAPRK